MTYKCTAALLLFFSLASGRAAITVASNFEAGSVGKVERVSATHLRCPVAGESDQDKRNRQPSWFYFRLDGVAGQDLTIDLTALDGEYNYRPHKGEGLRNMRPVYSYDDRTWRHFETAEWVPDVSTIRVRIKPAADRIWFARQAPYTNEHLKRLLDSFARHPHLRESVAGQTVGGRPMRLLTITNPAVAESGKKVLWLMVRQHAWESGTSWVAEGALRFLLSDDPEAVRIRDRYIFQVFPMADPDGVARGGVRFNAHGFDLNRNWDAVDARLMPEIAAQRKAMLEWVDGGRRIDFFLTLHNTESADFIGGPAEAGPLAQRFWKLLVDGTTFYSPKGPRVEAATTTPDMKGRMSVNQALFAERKIPAFLMEQMVDSSPRLGHPPTVDDRLGFGSGLVRAMCAAVERSVPAAARKFPNIPAKVLEQPPDIPPFWVTTVEQVNLHCGALSTVVESPSHSFTSAKRTGPPFDPSKPKQALVAPPWRASFGAAGGGQACSRSENASASGLPASVFHDELAAQARQPAADPEN